MTRRSTTWQKATALVPVALLSGAWTVSLAVSSATASGDAPDRLPDGTRLPAGVVEAPATISNPGEIAPGIPAGSAGEVIATASTNGIPAAALAAYQRASQVIAGPDPDCRLDWTLLAAIGRVESDHGRYGGNVLSTDGVSTPGIFGIPLDGTHGTQRISDTDGGQFDQDPLYDRAVGPMQFIPSTWSVVGVDGDGDGKRNPQDIDDSALAAAVYLCSGEEDLSTEAGQDAAIYRYNHSEEYVELVKAIAEAYASGDYTAVPTSSYAPTYFGPSYDDSVFDAGTIGHQPKPHKGTRPGKTSGGSGGGTGTGGGTATQPPPSPAPGTGGGDGGQSGDGPGKDLGDTITKVPPAVDDTVTALEEATAYCTTNLTQTQLDLLGGVDACVEAYLDGGANAVAGLLEALDLGGLLNP